MSEKKGTPQKPLSTDALGKGNLVESPLANTGATHVYRTDLGESLPPQKDTAQKDQK